MAAISPWMRAWVVLIGFACSPDSDPVEPVPSAHSSARVVVTHLQEAVQHQEEGRRAHAVSAWREAYAEYRAVLADPLQRTQGRAATVDLEYQLGRIRHELEMKRGKPKPIVREVEQLLWEGVDRLPVLPEAGAVEYRVVEDGKVERHLSRSEAQPPGRPAAP